MRFTLFALAAATVSAVLAAEAPPKELVIDKTYVPEVCTMKSQAGDKLAMHYTGTLFDTGAEFDSSIPRNSPFEFNLGSGQVIKGWDKGLLDMCIGEKRKLTIPPHMGYGARGFPPVIPAESTLVFTVELLEIKNRKQEL